MKQLKTRVAEGEKPGDIITEDFGYITIDNKPLHTLEWFKKLQDTVTSLCTEYSNAGYNNCVEVHRDKIFTQPDKNSCRLVNICKFAEMNKL